MIGRGGGRISGNEIIGVLASVEETIEIKEVGEGANEVNEVEGGPRITGRG